MLRSAQLAVALAAVALASPAHAQYSYPSSAQAPGQRLELVGLAGYHISTDLDFVSGSATLDDGPTYGAALRLHARPGQTVDFLWMIVPTNAHVRSTFGVGESSLTINYFQIGGTTSVRRDRLEPYFGGTLGAAVFSPGTLTIGGTRFEGSDAWRFAFTFGGGLKFWLAEKVALQFDARMLLPVWFSTGSIYVGTGGAALGVSGGIPIIEGTFTGGLVVGL